MNGITSFRLCKLSNKELTKRVDDHVDNMYETCQIPLRNIPAKPDDDFDLLVGELLLRFIDMEEKGEKDD